MPGGWGPGGRCVARGGDDGGGGRGAAHVSIKTTKHASQVQGFRLQWGLDTRRLRRVRSTDRGDRRRRTAYTASRALIAQATPSSAASTASWSCQPVTGSWASHQHQRSSPASSPSSAGSQRPVVEGVAERGDQPQRAEAAGGGAPPPAERAAAGAGPGQPGDGLRRRQLGPPGRRRGRAPAARPRRRRRRRRRRPDRWSSSSTARRAGARRARPTGRRGAPARRRERRRRRAAAGVGGRRELGAGVVVARPARTPAPTPPARTAARGRRAAAATDAAVDRLAAEDPLVGHERRARPRLQQRRQLRATCGAGRRPRSAGRCVKRPEPSSSTPAAHGAGASSASRYSASVAAGHSWRPVPTAWRARVAQPAQAGPVAGRAAVVDEPHEPVEVGAVDQPVELVVGRRAAPCVTRAARGSGRRSRRRAAPRARPATPPAAAAPSTSIGEISSATSGGTHGGERLDGGELRRA